MANENETFEQALSALTSRFLFGKQKSLFPQEIKKLTDNLLATHKREVESLTWKIDNYAQVVAAKDKEIANRNSLIKELADALSMEIVCHDDCASIESCATAKRCDSREYRALVAKAREVVK